MIYVEIWRARIGLFHCNKPISCYSLSASNFSPSAVPVTPQRGTKRKKDTCIQSQDSESSVYTSLPTPPPAAAAFPLSSLSCIDSTCLFLVPDICVATCLLITAVICQLLMTSGDIETNPGPRLRADSKPQLADLQHLTYTTEDGRRIDLRLMDQLKPHIVQVAVALWFPEHVVADIIIHNKNHRSEDVCYLLNEWLRGANMKLDPRPVTWRTLIEALRNANCQKEANILEKYLTEPTSHDTEISGVPTEHTPASANRSSDGCLYHVSAQYKRDFVDLQEKFGNMFDEVQKDMERVPVDDLKQYCSRFRDLKTDVQYADTTNDVMKIVYNGCTLVAYCYFEKIANRFHLQESVESIEHYRSRLVDFCTHTLEEHSYAKLFCEDHPEPIYPSSNKEITFKLEWEATKKSLEDIRDVLRMVFKGLTDRVEIVVIDSSVLGSS